MNFKEITERIKFWQSEDKIGPDFPLTHWQLYFPSAMLKLCKSKFKYFDDTAQFRPFGYARVCSQISIGRRVVIRPNTMLCASPLEFGGKGQIIIEDDVLLANAVQIHTDKHFYENPNIPILDQGYKNPQDIVIKRGSWIGANCVILGGVTIGENSVIGAGSVVTRSIPDRVVAIGVPAKIVKEIKAGQLPQEHSSDLIDHGVKWYNLNEK